MFVNKLCCVKFKLVGIKTGIESAWEVCNFLSVAVKPVAYPLLTVSTDLLRLKCEFLDNYI
jgi:hypothetical protein